MVGQAPVREVRAPVLDCRVAPMSTFPAASPLPIDGGSLDLDGLEAVARRGGRVVARSRRPRRACGPRDVSSTTRSRAGRSSTASTPASATSPTCTFPLDHLRELQLNLLRSHAAGVGAPLGEDETRALLLLRANVLAKGFSGVRLETLELLVELLNRRVHPVVPSQGSVGASGDLAPLAHLALVLIGEGECVFEGRRLSGADGPPRRRPRARSRSSRRRAWRSSTARS